MDISKPLVNRVLHGADTHKDIFKNLSNKELYFVLSNQRFFNFFLKNKIPGLPSEFIQQSWTGMSGKAALKEALHFVNIIYLHASRCGIAIKPNSKILDFGCGWGRISRFFMRDIDTENIHGVDCYPAAIELARQCNKWGYFSVIDPMPPASFDGNSFDIVYLFSVFSHLSEEAHLKWVNEFHRLLKPGGLLVATTRPKEFIILCENLRKRMGNKLFEHGAAASFQDAQAFIKMYDDGLVCHSPTGGGGPLEKSFYGETCIPEKYISENWTGFTLLDFMSTPEIQNQNVIVARKTA